MRIDIQTFIAVLSLAAIFHPCFPQNQPFSLGHKTHRRSSTRRDNKFSNWPFAGAVNLNFDESDGRPWLTHRDHMLLLRQEGGDEGHAVECCPSRLDMIEPDGGKTQDDMYVELYKDGETRQRFYELSCREDVFNKPCRFLDRKLYNQSRCVQKYSYTYALVRDPKFGDNNKKVTESVEEAGVATTAATIAEAEVTEAEEEKSRHHHQHHEKGGIISKEWKMDYIRVRSGCSCEVIPKLKKKRNQKAKKSGHRNRKSQFEGDET